VTSQEASRGHEVPDALISGGNFVDALLEEVPFSCPHGAVVIVPVILVPRGPVDGNSISAFEGPPSIRVFASTRFLGVGTPCLGEDDGNRRNDIIKITD
jgi:hypothetical protein